MNISVDPGNYVVAVSGGVDSVVLLDLLSKKPDLTLTVAHFDHGIRDDSVKDRQFVQKLAKHYGLRFIYDEGNLGPDVSEAIAREARYKFLRKVKINTKSKAIVTAHHQDDVIETVIINMIRGTGRKGMSSLSTTEDLSRPLIGFTKVDIKTYANKNKLSWRDDPSNKDTKYLRNHIRLNIIPKMTLEQKIELHNLIVDSRINNSEIDTLINTAILTQPGTDKLNRGLFIMLPHDVSKEVMASWLRRYQVKNLNKKQIEQLVITAKTSKPDRASDVDKTHILRITENEIHITKR